MAQQAFYTKINAGAGVQFSGGTVAQATAVLHTNNVLYLRGGSAGLFLQNSDASEGMFLSNSYISLETNSAERLRVDSSGRLLINATTTSFNDQLYVSADAYTTGGWRVGTAATYVGKLINDSGILTLMSDGNRDVRIGNNNNPSILYVDTSAQSVGIGTASPTGVLDVLSTDAQRYARFRAPNGEERFEFHIGSTGNGARLSMFDHDGTTEGVRISASGNSYLNNSSQLGIGTSSPAALLDLTASSAPVFRMYRSGTGQVWTQEIDSSGRWQLREAASSGGTKYTRLQVDDPGNVTFSAYGSGSFTGTAAYNLQVDSSGNIIEGSLTSGTVTGSGTATYLPIWTGSSALGNSIVSSSGGDITINGSDNDPRVYINPLGGDIGDSALIQFNSRGHVGYTGGLIELGDNGQSKDVRLRVNTADLIFQTSNTTRMTVKTDGLVGIGTTSPGTNLDIQGTTAQSLRVKSDDSATIIIDSDGDNSGTSGSYLHYRDTGATKWTLYKETNNDFYLHNIAASKYPIHAKAGGDIILMEDGNKLGVGASTPSRTLHVGGPGGSSGGIMIAPTSGDAEIQFQDSGVTNAYITLDDGTGDMNFRDDSATVLTVDFSNERVGVLNASPQYALDVAGVIKGTSSIRVDAGSPYFGLYNSGTEKAYLQWSQGSSVLTLQSDGAINYTNNGLQKWTISGSEKMTLNTDGELGINQSNPRAKLEIYNTAVTSDADYSASETPSGQDSIILYSAGTAENTYGSISWVTGGRRRAMITAVAENSDSDYQGIAFYTQGTDGSGDFYESMRIKHSGQISFYDYRGTNNTGTPTYLLGTDANGLMVKTNSGSHLPGGPYLPLAGGSLSGPLTIQDSLSNPNPLLTLYNDSNGGGSTILFSDQTGQSQKGYFTFYHSDGASQGGGATFQFSSTETDMTLQVGASGKASRVVVWSANNQSEVGYGFADDVNTGMTRLGADQVGLIAGAVQGVYVSTTAVQLKNAGNTKLATTGGGVDITGALAVGNINMTGALSIDATYPRINLTDTNHDDDWSIINNDGAFGIYNVTDSLYSLSISTSNDITISNKLNIPEQIYHVGDDNTYFGFNANDTWRVVTGGSQRLEINNSGVKIGSGSRVTTILDEDDMASNSNTALSTQQSIKAYVDNSISGATLYKGTWDPSSGTYGSPDLSTASLQVNGQYYICSANGSATPNGAGTEPDSWHVGDWVIWNDDLGGSGLWQKIDNTSVISGAGTGQKVVKWDGSGTSETIADGPITFSGDNSTFAGNITMANPLTIEGGSAQIILKDTSDDDDHSILFRSNVGGDDYKITTKDFTSAGLGDGIFMGSEVAEPLGLITNDTLALTIDSGQDALFASDVAITAKLAVGATSVHASYDLYNQGTFYSNGAATINANLTVDAGSISISSDGANFATLTESGNGDFTIDAVDDIRLDAGGGDIVLRDDGSEYGRLTNDSQNFEIKVSTNDKDFKVNGFDDSVEITALTLDMSDGGKATFNNGWSSDGAATEYTWRIPNTSSNDGHWYKIARVTSSQSTRFKLQMVGGHSYSDGYYSSEVNAYGQLNNDNNYDLIFHRLEADNQGGNPIISFGQVDVDNSSTDLYVRLNTFAELIITAGISNGDLYPDDTSTGSSTTPTNFVAALEQFGVLSPTIFQSTVRLDSQLLDGTNDAGTSGQILSSTGNVTNWVDASAVIGGPYLPLTGGTLTGSGVVPLYVTSSGSVSYIQIQNSSTGTNTTSDGLTIGNNGTAAYIWNREQANLLLGTNDTTAVTIDSSQNATFAGTITSGNITTQSRITFDYGGDHYIETGTNSIAFKNSSGSSTLTLGFADQAATFFGTVAIPSYIYHKDDPSDDTYFGFSGNDTFVVYTAGGKGIEIDSNRNVDFTGNVYLAGTKKLYLTDDGTNNYIVESSDNVLDFVSAGVVGLQLSGTSANMRSVNFNGNITTETDSTFNIGSTSKRFANIWVDNINGGTPTTGGPYLPLSGGTITGGVTIVDDVGILFGSDGDSFIKHTGAQMSIYNDTGHIYMVNRATDKNIYFQGDNGIGGTTTYFRVDGAGENVQYAKNLLLYDNVNLLIGSGGDLQVYHNGSTSYIRNNTGTLEIRNQTSGASDVFFKTTTSAPSLDTFIILDGSAEQTQFTKDTEHQDSVYAKFGNSGDLTIVHTGSTGYIQNYTGDLQIQSNGTDADILLRSDDGSGGLATYMYLDGGNTRVQFNKDARFVDDKKVMLGTSDDLQIYHDGSNSYIDDAGTGSLFIRASAAINLTNPSGSENIARFIENDRVELYFNGVKEFETTSTGVAVTGNVQFVGAGVGNCGTRYITYNCPDDAEYNVIGLTTGGVDIPGTLDVTGIVTLNNNLRLQDSDKLQLGNSQDMELYHSSGTSKIDNNTGHLYIRNNVDNDDGSNIYIQAKSGENSIICNDDGAVQLYYNNSVKFYTGSSGVGAVGYYGFGSAGTSTGSSYYFRYGSVSAGATQGMIITTSDTGGSYFDGVAQFRNTNTGQGAGMFQMINFGALYGRYINFYRGSTSNIIGYIGYNATNTAVTYSTSSSDIRLKKNIVTWDEEVLPKFLALTPKKFDFKAAVGDKGADKVKGFIAQYEAENFPEVYQLNGNGQDARYGFHPMEMVPYLMKAVKELAEKNKDLERRLAALEK